MNINDRINRWLPILNAELDDGTDRSCVIAISAILDHLLGETLRHYLVPNAQSSDPLFDGATAPLGNFSSRIDFAFRIGIIGARISSELHRIRKIRNEFAHSFGDRSLDDTTYKDRVNAVITSLGMRERASVLFTAPYDTPRGEFIICVLLLICYLETVGESLGQLNENSISGLENLSFSDTSNG